MGTRVHYAEEVKWEVIKMKQAGMTNKEIMEQLGIKNKTQIKTWMRWYKTGQTYRFSQQVGSIISLFVIPACFILITSHFTSSA
ncbi:helix-turn-helix domain-containing protein [Bacillaceae bacterium HSR45]|nr:helix-turn-helix domain-containing protein [Bacillaceae bacterium HSR45]